MKSTALVRQQRNKYIPPWWKPRACFHPTQVLSWSHAGWMSCVLQGFCCPAALAGHCWSCEFHGSEYHSENILCFHMVFAFWRHVGSRKWRHILSVKWPKLWRRVSFSRRFLTEAMSACAVSLRKSAQVSFSNRQWHIREETLWSITLEEATASQSTQLRCASNTVSTTNRQGEVTSQHKLEMYAPPRAKTFTQNNGSTAATPALSKRTYRAGRIA